jgi:hypothetical protein
MEPIISKLPLRLALEINESREVKKQNTDNLKWALKLFILKRFHQLTISITQRSVEKTTFESKVEESQHWMFEKV